MRQLGGVLGIAVTVAVFGARGGYASAADFVAGFRGALLAAAAMSLLGALAGLALPARRSTEPAGTVGGTTDEIEAVAA